MVTLSSPGPAQNFYKIAEYLNWSTGYNNMLPEVCLLYTCMPKVQWEDHCSKKNFQMDKYNKLYKFRIKGLGTAVLPWQQN